MNWSKLKFWKKEKELPKPKIIEAPKTKPVIPKVEPKIIIKEVIKELPPKIIIKEVIKEVRIKPKPPKTTGWKRWRYEKDGLTKYQVVRKKRSWNKVEVEKLG